MADGATWRSERGVEWRFEPPMPPTPAQSLAEQMVEEEVIKLEDEANRHPVNYRLLRPLTRSERGRRPGGVPSQKNVLVQLSEGARGGAAAGGYGSCTTT